MLYERSISSLFLVDPSSGLTLGRPKGINFVERSLRYADNDHVSHLYRL